MKKIILCVLVLLLSGACKLTVKESDDSDFSFSLGGICRVLDGTTQMNCIEFRDGAYTEAGMDTACDDFSDDYFPQGANGTLVSYSGVLVSCSASNRVGVCAKSNYLIHYYSSNWGAGAAQSDCASKGGTFN